MGVNPSHPFFPSGLVALYAHFPAVVLLVNESEDGGRVNVMRAFCVGKDRTFPQSPAKATSFLMRMPFTGA